MKSNFVNSFSSRTDLGIHSNSNSRSNLPWLVEKVWITYEVNGSSRIQIQAFHFLKFIQTVLIFALAKWQNQGLGKITGNFLCSTSCQYCHKKKAKDEACRVGCHKNEDDKIICKLQDQKNLFFFFFFFNNHLGAKYFYMMSYLINCSRNKEIALKISHRPSQVVKSQSKFWKKVNQSKFKYSIKHFERNGKLISITKLPKDTIDTE